MPRSHFVHGFCVQEYLYNYEIRAMFTSTFVDHTIYRKIDYTFPNQNKLSALVELNDIKWYPYTPTLYLIKKSGWKLNCKKTKISAVFPHIYDTNDEMVNYEMLLLSYISQEICAIYEMLLLSYIHVWQEICAMLGNVRTTDL